MPQGHRAAMKQAKAVNCSASPKQHKGVGAPWRIQHLESSFCCMKGTTLKIIDIMLKGILDHTVQVYPLGWAQGKRQVTAADVCLYLLMNWRCSYNVCVETALCLPMQMAELSEEICTPDPQPALSVCWAVFLPTVKHLTGTSTGHSSRTPFPAVPGTWTWIQTCHLVEDCDPVTLHLGSRPSLPPAALLAVLPHWELPFQWAWVHVAELNIPDILHMLIWGQLHIMWLPHSLVVNRKTKGLLYKCLSSLAIPLAIPSSISLHSPY